MKAYKKRGRMACHNRARKRPHYWGRYSKRQKGGKSGKTLQGVVLTSRATIRELLRTLSCGEGHCCVRPLLLYKNQALAAPKETVTWPCDRDHANSLRRRGLNPGGCRWWYSKRGDRRPLKVQIAAHSLHDTAVTFPSKLKNPRGCEGSILGDGLLGECFF
jgi:hypothetical protein